MRLVEWIKTHDPTTCGLEEIHFISIDTNTLKVKRWGGGEIQTNCNQESRDG